MRGLLICLFLSLPLAALIAAPGADAPSDAVEVRFVVALVSDSLEVRPVPKATFIVYSGELGAELSRFTTSFEGEASVELPEGSYRVRSAKATTLDGNRFEWDVEFTVSADALAVLELSNDNAVVAVEPEPSKAAVVLDEGSIYRKHKGSVFTVMAEGGSGTGFLVDPSGLILTNHHVVVGSSYLAVKLDEERKYPAALVLADELNDIAVLRVHSDVVSGRHSLSLAADQVDAPPVSVGERVLALGSPLATESILTSGIVSKVEMGVIHSDVNINPGSSGGPLFNSLGEVIGINTFGQGSPSGGPGVSGIVRIYLALPLLEQARKLPSEDGSPEFRRLPVVPRVAMPPEALRERALRFNKQSLRQYHVEAGKMDVQFITPVVVSALEVQAERDAAAYRNKRSKRKRDRGQADVKQYTPGQDFYQWRRYAGDYSPVVTIQAVPEIGMTGGSLFAAVMLGPNIRKRYRFKTDFDRMELTRSGAVVEPIHPGRSVQVVNQDTGLNVMEDVGFYGAYQYPPEAFRPGAEIVLRVWQQGKAKPKVRTLSPQLLQKIWYDLKPYFESLESAVVEEPG